MENSLACPKCESRKLWRIERYDGGDSSSYGGPWRLVHQRQTPPRRPPREKWSLWSGYDTGVESYTTGLVDAYVCAACGYTEFWSHGFEKLEHNPESGIHFIDTTPQQGQYR